MENSLVKACNKVINSLRDYSDEERTYKVDAHSVIELIAALEEVKSDYLPTKDVLNKAKQHGLLQGWSEATS